MLKGARRLDWLGNCTEELFSNTYKQLMLFLEGSEETPGDKKSPIVLYIKSVGGEIGAVLAWYDLINYILSPRVPITALGSGDVASAAVILLLSVPRKCRFITPNTMIYLHPSNIPLDGGDYSSGPIGGMKKCLDWWDERYNNIIASETKLSVKRVNDMRRDETVITPVEAKRLGFVHDILPLKKQL